MISKDLSLWIAQSESWQTFIDFRLPEDSIAKYLFVNRYGDFYISLFGEMYEILEDVENRKTDILPIAKGLEIFSLTNKRDSFSGINHQNNILFAAGLYYLADFSASAFILANLFNSNDYESEIDYFVSSFLKRKLDDKNSYSATLKEYLVTGDVALLETLLQELRTNKDKAFKVNPFEFSMYFLAESILTKFQGNNIWADLIKHNSVEHWQPYIDRTLKKKLPVWDFFPSQKLALEKGILNNFKSIALQTPTSSGKTSICELIIYNEYKRNPDCKVLYLAPYRALASELKQSFGKNLSLLNVSSKTIYGGNIPTASEKELIQNVTLLISTPEKFMAMENAIPDFLTEFTMIICDEGHLLDEGNRGLNYELLLARLKQQRLDRKFIFISAIVPNIDKINAWLGGSSETVIVSNYRATEIEYGFLKPSARGSSYYLDVNPFDPIPKNYKLNKFITKDDFKYVGISRGKEVEKIYKYESFKTLSSAVALRALQSGTVALFNPTKGGKTGVISQANEIMNMLEKGLDLPKPINYINDIETVNDLTQYFTIIFGENFSLVSFAKHGALYHHGDLPQYVREVIEDCLRSEKIKFVICTNTLAEGVNLPIRNIIVYSTRRFDEAQNRLVPLRNRDLKNLFGRAGRAGKETKGLVIAVNKSDFDTIEKVIKNIDIEDVEGHLFYIISLITDVIRRRRLILTNEILNVQDEEFKELIDAIDVSIIDLLGEEITSEDLTQTIQGLINETFAKLQADESQTKTLNDLINLRGDIIKPYIESGEFKYIKQSGATIRNFAEIISNLDLANIIWQNTSDPLSNEWMDFIFSKIFALPTIQYKLNQFNKANKTFLTIENIKEASILWIQGNWFDRISQICLNDVDICLRLVNSFIGYHIQSVVTVIIRNAQLKLEERKQVVSQVIVDFPQYLLYGLKNPMELALIEVGFNDRIGIIELAKILKEDRFYVDELNTLKVHLRDNRADIFDRLLPRLPNISKRKNSDSFSFLELLNMN